MTISTVSGSELIDNMTHGRERFRNAAGTRCYLIRVKIGSMSSTLSPGKK
jgi:hypothetical protein